MQSTITIRTWSKSPGYITPGASQVTEATDVLIDKLQEELDVPLDNKNWIGSLSKGHEVHEIVFRETDGAYDLDWHTAPCRQFIIMTNGLLQMHRWAWSFVGGVDVTTTDGVTKRFSDGDVLLVEDTTGKGHRSKAVDNKPRKSILVKLRDNAPAFMST